MKLSIDHKTQVSSDLVLAPLPQAQKNASPSLRQGEQVRAAPCVEECEHSRCNRNHSRQTLPSFCKREEWSRAERLSITHPDLLEPLNVLSKFAARSQ